MKYYASISEATGKIYLDKARRIHAFSSEEGEAAYRKSLPYPGGPAGALEEEEILKQAARLGAKAVLFHGSDAVRTVKVQEDETFGTPGSAYMKATLILLKETREKRYLERLATGTLLVPVKIRNEKGLPLISYAAASPGGSVPKKEAGTLPIYYLAFTDLASFYEWAGEQEDAWHPVSMAFWQLSNVLGQSGVIFDAGSPEAVMCDPFSLMTLLRKAMPEGLAAPVDAPAPKEKDQETAEEGACLKEESREEDDKYLPEVQSEGQEVAEEAPGEVKDGQKEVPDQAAERPRRRRKKKASKREPVPVTEIDWEEILLEEI